MRNCKLCCVLTVFFLGTYLFAVESAKYGPGRAKTCLMPYANNKGADQPAHPRSLISAFVVRSLDSIISLVSRSEISRF